MHTLFQIHSNLDQLKSITADLQRLWHAGDAILLMGDTVAFIDWLKAYLDDYDIQKISGIYALSTDVQRLGENTVGKLHLDAKLSAQLDDSQWVELTQSANKVITLSS